MKWYHKIAAGLILSVTCASTSYSGQKIDIAKYTQENVAKIAEAHEKRMEISHYELPEISFTSAPFRFRRIAMFLPKGLYYPEEDRIELSCILAYADTTELKSTIDHELNHFYQDKLSESIGLGNWPVCTGDSSSTIGGKLISEGIAVYFEKEMNNKRNQGTKNFSWPDTLSDFFSNKVIYDGGYRLVAPVIDAYGRKGVEYLITNPPSGEDWKDLRKYQKRVLDALSN